MDIYQKISRFIEQHNLINEGAKIVVGLSGGPDSVFLLHFLAQQQKEKNISLIAAHLDHEWRTNSHSDVQFCHEMAHKLNIPFVGRKVSQLDYTLKFNGSLEEKGRLLRRHFFKSVAQEHNANLIALAHHLQDQEETFFIRLMRGSSLTGLTAMRPKHGTYIRPLLETNKKEIVAWLDENNIPYLIDPTNESPTFLRNRIRNTVLPAIQECDKRFDANFLATLNHLKETEDYLEQQTQKIFELLSEYKEGLLVLNLTQLFSLHPTMLYRTIMYWLIKENVPFSPSKTFFEEIVRFLKNKMSATHTLHEQWSIIKKDDRVSIKKNIPST